jgi:2-amino-4-hydroxy-6-hydroxymethyldihydropteridine diphosphokinase
MNDPVLAFIAIGANLGDAQATVQQAMQDISAWPDVQVIKPSSLYRSAPVDSSGPDYINAVMSILTPLRAPSLLRVLQKLELEAGRERPYPNAPRTLDLDLIFYGDARIDSPQLTVPHPRWHERAFVVLPLAEIAREQVSVEQLAAVRGQAITRLANLP